MDLNDLRKLVRLMVRADLSELEIDDANKGVRVHLKRGGGPVQGDALPSPVVQVVPGAGHPAGSVAAPAAPAPAPGAAGDELPPGTQAFTSPMVGTFYRASSPDTNPFVEVGAAFDEDSVLCIIEAMKVMNEIKAEIRGTIVDVLVENGEPVEFGQPLFVVKRA